MHPDFFVIGAYRSGTTMLYRYLRQHPSVFLPLEKEPNFFAVDGNPSVSAVLAERSTTEPDEYARLYADAGPDQVRGDISPEYLRNPWASETIATRVPGARLVAVLRNPIERAWSDYLLHVRDGNETAESFQAALAAQPARQRTDHRAGHYIDSGLYGEQLQRYFDRFDAEQIQVHLFEDVMADPVGELHRVFRHIGVDDTFDIVTEAQVNASGVPTNKATALLLRGRKVLRPLVRRSLLERVRPTWERFLGANLTKPTMTDADRTVLADLYRDDISHLADLIQRDLRHWLEPAH